MSAHKGHHDEAVATASLEAGTSEKPGNNEEGDKKPRARGLSDEIVDGETGCNCRSRQTEISAVRFRCILLAEEIFNL
jgi:hypothetical protein